MSYEVRFGRTFDRNIKQLKKRFPNIKTDIKTAISLLIKQPDAGDVMPRSSGMRKLRIPNSDSSKGKRGGYRLIYFVADQPINVIYLLALYSKSDQENVSAEAMRQWFANCGKLGPISQILSVTSSFTHCPFPTLATATLTLNPYVIALDRHKPLQNILRASVCPSAYDADPRVFTPTTYKVHKRPQTFIAQSHNPMLK